MLKWKQAEIYRKRERESNTHRHTRTHTLLTEVLGGAGFELVVVHRSISGSSDKILCYYTSELQMMQCWETEQGEAAGRGAFKAAGD